MHRLNIFLFHFGHSGWVDLLFSLLLIIGDFRLAVLGLQQI